MLDGPVTAFEGRSVSAKGRRWRAGAPRDLYIMYKLDPSTPGTDLGWVYGTVSQAGEVTSAGRVKLCMECHEDADVDRVFGLSE